MVHDASAQTEARLYGGVREIHVPARHDSLKNFEIQPVEFGRGQIARAHVSKTYCTEFYGSHQLQFGLPGNQIAELLGVTQIILD